jgi:GAF domain-containing protein
MEDAALEGTRLAEMFAEVARKLLIDREVNATLHRIVTLAQETLEHAESVGVSIIKGRTIESPASSAELAHLVDRLQEETNEGPCLDALRHNEVLLIGNLGDDDRWPKFAKRAHAETGVTSIMSVRLFADGDALGSLNVYSTKPNAFDERGLALAAIFATHAAIALTRALREESLERKAEGRDLIGRAKGILIAQRHITDDEAFVLLREASQRLNLKLTKIADGVNYTGQLP